MHLKYWRPQGLIADGAVQDLELHGDAGGGAILPLAATPFLLRFRSSFTGINSSAVDCRVTSSLHVGPAARRAHASVTAVDCRGSQSAGTGWTCGPPDRAPGRDSCCLVVLARAGPHGGRERRGRLIMLLAMC